MYCIYASAECYVFCLVTVHCVLIQNIELTEHIFMKHLPSTYTLLTDCHTFHCMYTFTGTSQLAWCKYNTLHDTNGSFFDNMCRFMLKTYSFQCQHTDSCPMKICISGIKHAVSFCESRLLLSPVTYFPRTPSWKVLWSAFTAITVARRCSITQRYLAINSNRIDYSVR